MGGISEIGHKEKVGCNLCSFKISQLFSVYPIGNCSPMGCAQLEITDLNKIHVVINCWFSPSLNTKQIISSRADEYLKQKAVVGMHMYVPENILLHLTVPLCLISKHRLQCSLVNVFSDHCAQELHIFQQLCCWVLSLSGNQKQLPLFY